MVNNHSAKRIQFILVIGEIVVIVMTTLILVVRTFTLLSLLLVQAVTVLS